MLLDALSLACNIMTVIDFGHMLFEVSRRAYRAGTPDADAESTAHDLSRATKILETSISAGMQPITSEESELLRIANSCREAAKKLGEMYEKLAVPRSGQISWSGRATKAVLVGMKRQWQRHKFDELNNVLIGCQTAMQTRILVYLYQTNKAQEAMRLEEFSTLNRSLQNFIRAVSKAKFGMDDLLLRLNDLHALQLNTRDDLHTIQLETKSSIQQDRLLASLKFDGMNQRFNHDVRDAHHDTFKWLFGENIDSTTSSDVNSRDSTLSSWSIRQRDKMLRARQETFDDFGQWLKSDSSLYWISGKAGAGKSTLMKFICQHLSHSKPTADTVVLHYFFWFNAPTSTMQRSIAGMLSTLLYQLLQHDRALVPHLIHSMPEARLEDKDSPWDWTLDELERCLHTALRSRGVKRSVCLIIDGLDEVLEADGANALLRSIRQLEKLRTVRLCVSSRPEPVFNRDLGHSRHLRLEKLTAPDRHRFVMDALQPYASRFPRDSCTEGIEWFIAQLVGKSEGVFLWTRVATQSLVRGLNDGNSIETLKQRLDATPADLYGLFASMWKRLGEDEQFYRTGAANVFRLLLCDDEKNISARLLEGRSDNIDLMTLHLSLHREESARVIQEFERPDGTVRFLGRDLLADCQKTCEMILSHCVGLVDIDSQPRTKIVDACIDLGESTPHPASRVRFVHRTASEFLRNTPEGKTILESHSLGEDSPLFRLYLACIARAALFRGPGHKQEDCLILWDLDMHQALEFCQLHRLQGLLCRQQSHEILQSLHTIYFHLLGDSTNPRFTGWIRNEFRYPFVLEAATFGFGHYVRHWMAQHYRDASKAVKAHILNEFAVSILSEVLSDSTRPPSAHQKDCLDTLERLLNWCTSLDDHQPWSPMIKMSFDWTESYNFDKLISPYGNFLSLFESLASLQAHLWHDRQVCDTILGALKLFASSSINLHERFIGAYYPRGRVSSPWQLPWHTHISPGPPSSSVGHHERRPGVLIETDSVWRIQLLATTHRAEYGSSLLEKELLDFVATNSGDGPLPGPKALLLLSTFWSPRDESKKRALQHEAKVVPPDLETYILSPLTSDFDSTHQQHIWDVLNEDIHRRIKDCWEIKTSEEVLTESDICDFLVAQGLLMSKEQAKALYKACGIEVPTGYSEGFRTKWLEDLGLSMAPPSGAPSSEQEFARIMFHSYPIKPYCPPQ